MNYLLVPTVITLVLVITHILMDERKQYWFYIVYFFMFLLINWAFADKAEASHFRPSAWIECTSMQKRLQNLMPHERQYYQEKKEFHLKEGKRTFEDAQKRCKWLPEYTDRQLAQNCFITALSAIASGSPQSKALSMLVTALGQYGLGVLDEWAKIDEKLYWSQYHYEMYEFYTQVLGE